MKDDFASNFIQISAVEMLPSVFFLIIISVIWHQKASTHLIKQIDPV